MALNASSLDRRITFLKAAVDRSARFNTRQKAWLPFVTVWAEVRDALPSRAEHISEGVDVTLKPCRIRIRWRGDITSDMRIQIGIGDGAPVFDIVSGPAQVLGRKVALEMMAQEVSTLGNGA